MKNNRVSDTLSGRNRAILDVTNSIYVASFRCSLSTAFSTSHTDICYYSYMSKQNKTVNVIAYTSSKFRSVIGNLLRCQRKHSLDDQSEMMM